MRDSSLLIAIIGAILVNVCSSSPQSFHGSTEDEPVRMASESLVVKSYKEAESSTVATTKSQGDRFEEYQIYQGVMGRPGIDFPVYPQIPATSFSCRGVKKSGYYADLETDCQVFHICDGNRKISFLCPNGTIFRQSHLICDWWFRVDCGKSVQLYEESAEQLAADQKIYKARSEERERRRKFGKAAVEKGGELTSSEIYALDEPFHLKTRKVESDRDHFTSNGTRGHPLRNSFEGRKGERHSKKVVDLGAAEKFPNYNRDKQNGRLTENIRTSKPFDSRQFSTSAPVQQEINAKVSFVDNPVTPTTFKVRHQTQNSINFEANKENFQPAETGSLVEDLNNRKANFGFNSTGQTFEYTDRDKSNAAYNSQNPEVNNNFLNNFAYHNNRKINQSFEFNNLSNNQNRKDDQPTTEAHTKGSSGFAYNDNGRTDDSSSKNINFNYDDKYAGEQPGRDSNFTFKDRRIHPYTFETSRTNYKKADESTEPAATAYTTEFFNYESKRTNPVERQETALPTFQTTRKSQSSKYRSSTPAYVEQERQFFAETASFATNRGGKSYSDLQSQFNAFNKGVATTTPNPYKTTFYTTSKRVGTFSTTPPPPVQKYSTANFNFNPDFYRTSTHRPIKQHSRKVTIYPSTSPQTTFANRIWQTTTFLPYVETTTNDKFTVDDIYFTTTTPDKEVEFITETQSFGVSQKQKELQISFENNQSTPRPEVDISLQELNINKISQPVNGINKSYEDFIREGLEVPPSSGPNAVRTYALYFATTNNNAEEIKTTVYLPVSEPELTTLTPFEIKKKEIVKQVDELVQRSSLNTSEHISHSEELPNSLTPNTQNSYSALFPPQPAENHTGTSMAERVDENLTESFETTAFESFTEEPYRINKELTKNDLDGSQSRGLVEPDPNSDTDYSKVSPDLRELAQVFTKALSAYLDDPEAFRRVLSEIRPTEPTIDSEVSSSNPLEYPSATQEEDEVLDFSDVTKSSYRKKTSTASNLKETATDYVTEAPPTNSNDIENFVLPINHSSWATNIELTAPLLESLDQSQSNYYTPPPYVGTTNAIAEEINNEFTPPNVKLPRSDLNEAVDSYLPIKGSVDDPSLPRYGGFQNNTNPTTKYSPYGAELTSTTYVPYGADLTSTANLSTAGTNVGITTFNPNNISSFFSHFSRNESEEQEIQLGKELNNLVLLQKFTTPRGSQKEITTPEPNLSTVHLTSQNDINQFKNVKLENGETVEKSPRGGKSLYFPEATVSSNHFEPNAKEINLELSPPPSTPKGFLITYSIGAASRSEPATYLPKATTPVVHPTTYSPGRQTAYTFLPETQPPTLSPEFENFSERLERLTKSRSSTENYTAAPPYTTTSFGKSTQSIERLAQLQETLMFNTTNLTIQQRDQARVSVEELMHNMNMTDSTANTLMKVMEMAAKNETYRRLVLLLVNDKSGKNKTVEESRLALLKALLTPVISPPRTVVPIPETSRLIQTEPRRRSSSRRSKSIDTDNAVNNVRTTAPTTTTQKRPSNGRKGKPSRGLTRAESNYKSGLGNLGVIRRTIENSKNKQVKINSIDDAILDSDSRAVELLRSLYSLAARWG